MPKLPPRRPDSKWSESNKNRVEKLIRSKSMTPAGLALVHLAKASGVWDLNHRPDIPNDPPPDFLEALDNHPEAKSNFYSLAPSHQRQYVGWIFTAKRPDTRHKRIAESIACLEKGMKLGMK